MLSAPLLAQVTVALTSDRRLTQLRNATSWLVRRAAGRVQQLTIDMDDELDKERLDAAEVAALIAGTLTAVGASGMLREVTVVLGLYKRLHLGAWAAAMSGLQQLSITGVEGHISVSGDLRGLTALQLLKLQNYHVEFAAGTRLPPALTHLSLQAVDCEDSEELIPPVS